MGSKHSKLDGGCYLPDTPTLQKYRAATTNSNYDAKTLNAPQFNQQILDEPKDPRSPSGCRTPISLLPVSGASVVPAQQPNAVHSTPAGNENAFGMLRKRILKGFSLNDPRSPQHNRTPIVLDEAGDRTFNLDDTFADLFVDSRAPATIENNVAAISELNLNNQTIETYEMLETPAVHNNSSIEIMSLHDEETMPCTASLQQIPKSDPEPGINNTFITQQNFDPRSPTIGVDRTPIIFSDEDEMHEDQMLEQILETLTLNLSNDSSMASFVSANNDLSFGEDKIKVEEDLPATKPANKHLERVRMGKQRIPPRKPARASKRTQQTTQPTHFQGIYIDSVKEPELTPPNTPKRTALTPINGKETTNSEQKRTPLSCVRNRTHLRSRSVERMTAKQKLQLPLQCFDDQLNPTQCGNVPNMHMLKSAEDSFNDFAIY